MDKILALTLSYILLYKYVALFILVFLGTLLLPVPCNVMLLVVGVFSSQGYMNFSGSLIVAITANVSGDATGYFLARYYGLALLRKIGRNRPVKFDGLGKYITNYGSGTIIITRFVGAMSVIVNLFCGLTKFSFRKFILSDIAGNILSISIVMVIGVLVGQYWNQSEVIVDWVSGLLTAILIIFAGFKVWRWNHEKKLRAAG